MNVEVKGIETKSWADAGQNDVVLVKLINSSGAYVEVTNYGATLVSVVVPDRFAKYENVVLGFPTLKGYVSDTCYIGSTVGRFANRIGGANFELDGKMFSLEKNDGENCNHGGSRGFHKKVFDYRVNDNMVIFSLSSPHMEGGFPGNIEVQVKYKWTDDNELIIEYKATTDCKTVMNFTNHAYFNLSPGRDILDHALTIRASQMLETNSEYIPTGRIVPVADKGFHGNTIYQRSLVHDGRISGINAYYVFDGASDNSKSPGCTLSESLSGRILEVFTSYPGLQLYTGDFLTSTELNNHSSFHKPFDGLCLECQYFPDSPNHPHFPSAVVSPGDVYEEHIVYKFSTRK